MEPACPPDSPEARRLTQLRYWKERRAAAARAGPLAEADVAECDGRIKALEQEALKARPWAARVQAATDALRAAAERSDKVQADLAAARRAAQALELEAAHAQEALARAESSLAAVQAEGAPQCPPGTAAAGGLTPSSVAAALDVLALAGAAVQQGGGGGAGGAAMSQLVEQLRALVVSAAAGPGATAGAPAGGAAAAGVGRAAYLPCEGSHGGAGAPGAAAPEAVPQAPHAAAAAAAPAAAPPAAGGGHWLPTGTSLPSVRRGTSPSGSASDVESQGSRVSGCSRRSRSRERRELEQRTQADVRAGRQRTLAGVMARSGAPAGV